MIQMASPAAVPVLELDPFSAAFLSEPYRHHGMLRDAGPLFWLRRLNLSRLNPSLILA